VNPPANPEIKNVTPSPSAGPGPTAATAPARKGPTPIAIIASIAVVVVLVVAFALFHHKSHYASIADDVTQAIANNNMAPVADEFNAIRRPELADRGKVGRLSDMVIALGAFKGSTEITPAGSPPGFHEFTETFANGTLDEKYELDSDGKIVKFHIGPPPSP
jgi:hypothetical protein